MLVVCMLSTLNQCTRSPRSVTHLSAHSLTHSLMCPICRAGLDEITTRIAKRKAARVLTYYGSGRSQSKELVESYDIGTGQMHLISHLSSLAPFLTVVRFLQCSLLTARWPPSSRGREPTPRLRPRRSPLSSLASTGGVWYSTKVITRLNACAVVCAVSAHLRLFASFFCFCVVHSPLDQEQEDQDGHGRPPAAGRAALVSQRHPHSKQVSTPYWTCPPSKLRSHSCALMSMQPRRPVQFVVLPARSRRERPGLVEHLHRQAVQSQGH